MIASGKIKPATLILAHAKDYQGQTQYRIIRDLSRRYKIATSTLKYAFRKLVKEGKIKYRDVINYEN